MLNVHPCFESIPIPADKGDFPSKTALFFSSLSFNPFQTDQPVQADIFCEKSSSSEEAHKPCNSESSAWKWHDMSWEWITEGMGHM